MFSGSLHGHWQAIVTFQQMIILADKDGTIEITPAALSAITSIPLDIIESGIAVLEAPDANSRTPDEDGRRIIRINPERPWGWHITNYAHYRAIRTAEDRRDYHKTYWHNRKKDTQPDSTGTQPNQPIVEAKVEAKVYANNTKDAKASSVFKRPHLVDVGAYCYERRNTVDSESFFDYYESNGWRVGKNPMKDWKAAVRRWEKNRSTVNGTHQQVDNSAVGKVRAANERARQRADRQPDAPDLGADGKNVRPPLDQ